MCATDRTPSGSTALALALAIAAAAALCRPSRADAVDDGMAALAAADLSRARSFFATAVSNDPSRPLALAGLAATSLLAGMPQRAISSFATAAELDAGAAWPHACLGAAFLAAGQIDQAARALEAAMARRPDWPAVRARLAFVQWRRGITAAALENARLARNQGERLFAPLVEAAVLLSLKDPSAAREVMQGAGVAPPGLHVALPEALSPASILLASAPAQVATPQAPAPQQLIEFTWPRPGAKVGGNVEICARAKVPLQYVVFYVDDQFLAVTNVAAYRAVWDTRRWRDGIHRLRAEGFDAAGQRVVSRVIEVLVANRNRTLDPARLAQDRRLGLRLAEMCLPVARPDDCFVLRGLAAAGAGAWPEALDALEEGFARWPWSRPLRTALEATYRDMGIIRPSTAEIHLLPGTREVAITFDDGPHPRITPYLLDVLARRGVRATFFLVGKQAQVYPDLVRAIVRAGHEVGSHSYTHANLRRLGLTDVMRELAQSRWAIRRACGRSVILFRPPGGHYSPAVREACRRTGFRPVFWTANISRYAGDPPQQVLDGLVADLARGGIVLLHNGEDKTPQIIEPLLDRLLAAGFKLGPVGQLVGVPEPYFALERPEKVGLAQ